MAAESRIRKPARRPDRGRPARAPAETGAPPFTKTLKLAASARSLGAARPETLVAWVVEGSRSASGLPPGRLAKAAEALIRSERFEGKRGSTLVFRHQGGAPAGRVILAGLGAAGRDDYEAMRHAAAAAAAKAADASSRTVTFTLPPALSKGSGGIGGRVRAVADGALLGTYKLRKYFTGDRRTSGASLRSVEILVASGDLREAREAARERSVVIGATNLARDLINEPACALTPSLMAGHASVLAKRAGLECRVHDESDLRKMGMGAFLAVAQGSHQAPRMIHLVYRPRGKAVRKIALVGKGLTFDSGGLSLKTAAGMETMKVDKGGSAAVLAAMVAASELGPPVEIHGLMGMTENMPGGAAVKPGDVVRTFTGKTVEILNTDAEGRLVLADVLGYASTLGVGEIVDLATLTGACIIAVGQMTAGLFTEDDALAGELLGAASAAGEKLWRLPLHEEFREQLRSEIADIKNTADRYGGASSAAMFLREFVGKGIRWAHVDIAGPAFMETSRHGYLGRGATGVGVRTLMAWIGSIRAQA